MEVAAIATDWDFKEIATYEAVQHVDETLMNERMVGDFWDKYNDVRAALQVQNAKGLQSSKVEESLIAFLDEHFADEKIILAGNSIHQDRKFIDNEWPELSKRLHYRMLDVSALKLVFDGKYKVKFAKPEAHRAMDDIRGSIEEMEYYLKRVKA